jgi:hypothetical protein
MAVAASGELLAEMCFRRVPGDIVDRDVVLAALWHLHLAALRGGFAVSSGRTFRHTLLGARCGLRATDFRAALNELQRDGLIFSALNRHGLTRRGFQAVAEIVDIDRVLAAEAALASRP